MVEYEGFAVGNAESLPLRARPVGFGILTIVYSTDNEASLSLSQEIRFVPHGKGEARSALTRLRVSSLTHNRDRRGGRDARPEPPSLPTAPTGRGIRTGSKGSGRADHSQTEPRSAC